MLGWLSCDSDHLAELEPLSHLSATELVCYCCCCYLLAFKFPSFVVSFWRVTISSCWGSSYILSVWMRLAVLSLQVGKQHSRNVLNRTFISALYLSVCSIFKFILHVYLHFYISCSLPLSLSSSSLFVSPVLLLLLLLSLTDTSIISTIRYFGDSPSSFHISFRSQKSVISPWNVDSLYWIIILKNMIWVLSMLLRLGCYFQYLSCEKRILLFI